MTTRKPPQKYLTRTAGLAALLLAGTWCAQALAASDIPSQCPELVAHTDAALQDILDEDAATPALRTIDSDDTESEAADEAEAATIRNTEIPNVATRLPGVSATDVPRFRRYMFRTDI